MYMLVLPLLCVVGEVGRGNELLDWFVRLAWRAQLVAARLQDLQEKAGQAARAATIALVAVLRRLT